jgi:hypothetical protein
MNTPRCCLDKYDALVALALGALDEPGQKALEAHVAVCPACRSVRDALAAEEVTVRSAFGAVARGYESIERAMLKQAIRSQPSPRLAGLSARRPFLKGALAMLAGHKRFTYAAAASLAVVAVLAGVVLTTTSSKAYALEQTTAAYRQLLNFHIRVTPPAEGGADEAWFQLTADGNLVQARADYHQSEDGPRIVVWRDRKADIWLQQKNVLLTIPDTTVLEKLEKLREIFDPKLAFERLQVVQQSGKADVQIHPHDSGIEVTVTDKATPNEREVYWVDPQTKLVTRRESYRQGQGGQWSKTKTIEYVDYNQPIPESIWQLDLPADVVRMDQTSQAIGVSKEGLTNEQVAVKVAREFFEALVAGDYDRAGQIYGGMPGSYLKKTFGDGRIVRIISVGEAQPNPKLPGLLQVPVEVELEANGNTMTRKFLPNIGSATNQPDRWEIKGGI